MSIYLYIYIKSIVTKPSFLHRGRARESHSSQSPLLMKILLVVVDAVFSFVHYLFYSLYICCRTRRRRRRQQQVGKR